MAKKNRTFCCPRERYLNNCGLRIANCELRKEKKDFIFCLLNSEICIPKSEIVSKFRFRHCHCEGTEAILAYSMRLPRLRAETLTFTKRTDESTTACRHAPFRFLQRQSEERDSFSKSGFGLCLFLFFFFEEFIVDGIDESLPARLDDIFGDSNRPPLRVSIP